MNTTFFLELGNLGELSVENVSLVSDLVDLTLEMEDDLLLARWARTTVSDSAILIGPSDTDTWENEGLDGLGLGNFLQLSELILGEPGTAPRFGFFFLLGSTKLPVQAATAARSSDPLPPNSWSRT